MEHSAARWYLTRVRRALTCSAASRRALLPRAEVLVEAFLQENPRARYQELVSAFGQPSAFAATMLADLDEEEVRFTRRRKTFLCRCLLAGLILLLILSSVFWYRKYQKSQSLNENTVVVIGPARELTEEEFHQILKGSHNSQGRE